MLLMLMLMLVLVKSKHQPETKRVTKLEGSEEESSLSSRGGVFL